MEANGEIYTTGQISKMLMVAPRTVSKWIDRRQLKGYRLPGGGDHRRVLRADLVDFCRDHGMLSMITPGPDTRIADALLLAVRQNGIDGEAHKTWLIDQLVRTRWPATATSEPSSPTPEPA